MLNGGHYDRLVHLCTAAHHEERQSINFYTHNFGYFHKPRCSLKQRNTVLTLFKEEAYLTFNSIFHKALNLSKFDCLIMLEFIPGTNRRAMVAFET